METKQPKVEVRRIPGTNEYTVWIVSGVQSFRLDYRDNKRACNWMKRMLHIAGIGK